MKYYILIESLLYLIFVFFLQPFYKLFKMRRKVKTYEAFS